MASHQTLNGAALSRACAHPCGGPAQVGAAECFNLRFPYACPRLPRDRVTGQ